MLEQKILKDYQEAMKARDTIKSTLLSCVRAEITNAAIKEKKDKLDDDGKRGIAAIDRGDGVGPCGEGRRCQGRGARHQGPRPDRAGSVIEGQRAARGPGCQRCDGGREGHATGHSAISFPASLSRRSNSTEIQLAAAFAGAPAFTTSSK